MTEWLTYKITQIKEYGVYQEHFVFIEELIIKYCKSEVLEKAFFNGDHKIFLEENIKLYSYKTPEILNAISDMIEDPMFGNIF